MLLVLIGADLFLSYHIIWVPWTQLYQFYWCRYWIDEAIFRTKYINSFYSFSFIIKIEDNKDMSLTPRGKRTILERLISAEYFEKFLDTCIDTSLDIYFQNFSSLFCRKPIKWMEHTMIFVYHGFSILCHFLFGACFLVDVKMFFLVTDLATLFWMICNALTRYSSQPAHTGIK